jgi:hypothetical protein
MNLKKTIISTAIVSSLTGVIAAPAQADLLGFSYTGLFTMLDPGNNIFQNRSYPYYDDTTWGYGHRTQISGTFTFDTASGASSGTVNPFAFALNGLAEPSDLQFQSLATPSDPTNPLMLGNLTFVWANNFVTTQIVLDASGLFAGINNGVSLGDTFDQTWCSTNTSCATPGSNDATSLSRSFPIGPVPLATSTFNTAGQTGFGTTLSQLSLGIDDGIGGSPMDNGPFSGFYANFDFTSMTVTNIQPSTVPVPASFWLFGSGLVALISLCKRK